MNNFTVTFKPLHILCLCFAAAVMVSCSSDNNTKMSSDDSFKDVLEYITDTESNVKFHDFGMLMMKTDNGDTTAFSVDENVKQYGIHDGTRILTWNGVSVDEAVEYIQEFDCPLPANEEMLSLLYMSSMGADFIQLTYIDDNGEEMFSRIPELNDTPERLIEGISALNK